MQSVTRLLPARRTLFCLLVACFFVTNALANIPASDEIQSKPATSSTENPSAPDSFNYQLTGRPDPFVPFIEPKVVTKLDEIVEDEAELSGMQLFEPGQLKLVAVLSAGAKKIAMVEDVTGKGYVINEGVLIGRHGVVSQISPDEVIITETTRTRAGKEIINTIVMRLNKEGDK